MKHLYTVLLCACGLGAHAQLTGTKTVGGSNPDYATLTAAVNALNTQGATGNVTFDIRPGTYTGQYALADVPGTPGTIHFRNSSNGAQAVILEFNATTEADNYIFEVDGTNGVTFDRLTFRPLGANYARAIVFFNSSDDLLIEQCVFRGSTNADGSGGFWRNSVTCDHQEQGTSAAPQRVTIIDNSFFNGYTAIDIAGGGFQGMRVDDLLIAGNEFIDQYAVGVVINAARGQVSQNRFATTVGDWYTAFRASFFDGGSQVVNNEVEAWSTNGCTGIEFSNTQSTTDNIVANNMVFAHGTGQVWGVAVFNLWGTTIAHNSVLVDGGVAAESFAFHHLSNFPDGQDALLRNNIFANNTGGAAYSVEVPGNVGTEDHNCLFTSGSVISKVGTDEYTTIAAHQAGTGDGQGDIDTDPVFAAQPDLHMHGCALDDAGQYMAAFPEDVDGQDRANPACDIGADEFNATFGTDAVQAPTVTILNTQLPYVLGLNADFTSYQWNSGATTPTSTINAGGDFECLVSDVNGCSYEINITVIVEIGTGVDAIYTDARKVYPNPATDQLFVTEVYAPVPYAVHTLDGRMVQAGTLNADRPLGLQQLVPGAYVLRLADGGVHAFIKR